MALPVVGAGAESSSDPSSEATTCPLQANSFFMALSNFLGSYLSGRPWTVVSVFRPFRCWRPVVGSGECTIEWMGGKVGHAT
jgi:hypothetical protein